MPNWLILPFHAERALQMPASAPPAAGSRSHVTIPHWYAHSSSGTRSGRPRTGAWSTKR